MRLSAVRAVAGAPLCAIVASCPQAASAVGCPCVSLGLVLGP